MPSDVVPTFHSQFDYLVDDDGAPVFYGSREEDYLADVTMSVATDFIGSQAADDSPFFLGIGYAAPHWAFEPFGGEVESPGVVNNPQRFLAGDIGFKLEPDAGRTAACAAPRRRAQRFLKAGLKVPRSPSFNEADVSDKPGYVRRQSVGRAGDRAARSPGTCDRGFGSIHAAVPYSRPVATRGGHDAPVR